MMISKTTFIRICLWLLSQVKFEAIYETPEIILYFLDDTRMSPKSKERILILLDMLMTRKITPRKFAKALFMEYPVPTRSARILSLREFKRITSGVE